MLLNSTVAYAQQSQPKALERISIGFGQCVGNLEQKSDELLASQKALLEAQTKIKELEEKLKDKK